MNSRCFHTWLMGLLGQRKLQPRGVTWFQTNKDDWVDLHMGKNESVVCVGRQGYQVPCPTGGSSVVGGHHSALYIFFVWSFYLLFKSKG